MLTAMVLAVTLSAQDSFDTDDPLDADFRTGVEVGAKIPEFRVRDFSGKEWNFEAIRETVPVYQGRARILKDVTISPRFRDEKIGIPVTFSYQACDDRVCYPPTQVKLALEVKLVPHDTERVPEAIQKKGKNP